MYYKFRPISRISSGLLKIHIQGEVNLLEKIHLTPMLILPV